MQFWGAIKQGFGEGAGSLESQSAAKPSCLRSGFDDVPQTTKKMLFIMHEVRTCAGRVGQWFRQQGYQTDICKPRWGDCLPASLEDYDGVVIFGGNMSVNDPLDYIKTEMDWLAVPLQEHKPILGICLGAQLLVKYLGGEVVVHQEGIIESGYYPVYPVKNSLIHNTDLLPKMVYEWHQEGFSLTQGMDCFLKGQSFENQAILYDDIHVGFQFHPEVTERILRRWITLLPEMLAEKGSQPALEQIKKHLAYHHDAEKWLDHFLTAWSQTALK